MAQEMSIEAILSAVDQNFTKTMEAAVDSLSKVVGQSNQTASATTSATSSVKNLATSLGLVAVAGKAFSVVKDSIGGAIDRFDTLNKYPVVMDALGYSARDVAKSSKLMQKGIDGLPTSLQDITSVAQQLAPLTGSATKASKSALALNNAFLASGASVADTSRGLQQYTQMLSTGKVDMMSYRTLMETMPIALRKVANAFGFTGKSAEQDLYNALQSGQISVDQLNDKFIELNKGQNGFAQLAKKNSAGIATSFANLKASVVKNLGNMLTAINNGFSKAGFGSIAQVLDNMKVGINGAFTAITPIVTQTTTVILNSLRSMFDFVNANKDWLTPLVLGVGAFVGQMMLLKNAISFVDTVKTFVASFKTIMQTISSIEKLNAALAAFGGVKMVVIAGIIAVVAGLVYFFTQTEKGKQMWQQFTTWLSNNAWVGKVIAGLVAITPAIIAMVKAFGAVKTIGTIFTVVKGLMMGLLAPIKLVAQALMALVATPVGAIIAAIVAVVAALTWFFTQTQAGQQLWQSFVTWLQTTWQALVQIATTVWTAIGNAISAACQWIVSTAQGLWQGFVGFWSGLWNSITSIASNVWSAIASAVSAGINAVKGIISSVMNGIKSVVSSAWEGIKNFFSSGVSFIKSVVHVDLSNAGREIMNSLLRGLREAWESVKSFVSRITKWFPKHKGPISVDRRLLIPAGHAIMNGLGNGLVDGFSDVQKSVLAMNKQITDAMQPDVSGFANRLNGMASDVQSRFAGSLTMQDSTLQMRNNALLRQIAGKDTTMILDSGVLVGATAGSYDQRLGHRTALKDRWS